MHFIYHIVNNNVGKRCEVEVYKHRERPPLRYLLPSWEERVEEDRGHF